MNSEHKELIHDYMNLNRRINKIEQRMESKRFEFDNRNYHGGTVFNDTYGLQYRGFKIDSEVCNYVDLMNTYKGQIKKNERKLDYFNTFLNTLDPHTVISLKRRYERVDYFKNVQELGHDRIVLEEISEIEEAINFEFYNKAADTQREAIQVEYTLFSDDTVEDSFNAMQNLLGV